MSVFQFGYVVFANQELFALGAINTVSCNANSHWVCLLVILVFDDSSGRLCHHTWLQHRSVARCFLQLYLNDHMPLFLSIISSNILLSERSQVVVARPCLRVSRCGMVVAC
jgi:hypothetical protein